MIHELRIYDTSPGRLPALLDRFPNVIMPFFDKHEMSPVGFWTDDVGVSNRVTYMLAFDDLAHRERAWAAFRADPERIQAFAYPETDPPFVARARNTILRPTSFSPLQKLAPDTSGGGAPRIFELRRYNAVPGRRLSALVNRFEKITLGYFQKYKLDLVGFWTDDIGLNVRLTYMLAFDDLAHRDRAWAAFRADPERIQAFAESERNGPLVASIRNTIMRPTSFSPLQ